VDSPSQRTPSVLAPGKASFPKTFCALVCGDLFLYVSVMKQQQKNLMKMVGTAKVLTEAGTIW